MTSATITRRVQRDANGNLTTDSTGQPLPMSATSDATSWGANGHHAELPEGEEVSTYGRNGSCSSQGYGAASFYGCTRSAGHDGPHRGGIGGQRLNGEWGIPVEPESPSTRISLDYTTGHGEITIPFTREAIEKHVAGEHNYDIGSAIRTALHEQLGCTGRNDGHTRSSIKVVDDEPELADAAKIQAEFDAFKLKVAKVGERYAKEHGFCSVYDRVIDELGLERPKPVPSVHEFELTLTLKVQGTTVDQRENLGRGWVLESVRQHRLYEYIQSHPDLAGILLDSDWQSDATKILDLVKVEVEDVRQVAA